MQGIEQQLLIREERIVTPLVEVLDTVNPLTPPKNTVSISPTLRQSLDELFPEQQYDEKDIQKAKETLGKIADEFTEIELKGVIAEVQFLAESWLDDFERTIFKGMTLKELLHEKGGV
ncbi:MAG: hypothetical protein G01um10145_63 [Microgenomates group bacterium Gr01-1014_5]|nr:MAG: hypothetical protein G01um10145_63 [Microgenomates group bacterium Gr01-1014_5]